MAQTTGGDILDSLLGYNRRNADEAYQNARNMYGGIDPNVEFSQMGPSEYGKIQEDPALRGAQMQALQRMQGISNAGGRDAQFRQGMNAAQQQSAQYERGQRGAIENQARARGQFGGGQMFAQQLQAQQSGADRAGNQGFDVASAAQQRALQALQGYGQQAGSIRSQDYNKASQAAAAQDRINQFNAAGANSQRQQNFQNQMGLAGQRSGLETQAGSRYDQRNRQGWNDMGNIVNTAGRAMGYGGF